MKVVIGLGNPGPEYLRTRHNVGFWVLDRLAARHGFRFSERAHRSRIAEGAIAGQATMLVRPETFMNRSGEAVAEVSRALGIPSSELLVTYDDVDLELGRVRVRPRGGSGGHRGVASIIEALGSSDFPRVRIGVGRPAAGSDTVEHVLEEPSSAEAGILDRAVERAADAVECCLREGVAEAMNRFNARDEGTEAPARG